MGLEMLLSHFHNPDTGTEVPEHPLSLCRHRAQEGAFHTQLPLLPGTETEQQAGEMKNNSQTCWVGERAAGTCCSSPCTNPLSCIFCPCTSTATGNGALAVSSASQVLSPKSAPNPQNQFQLLFLKSASRFPSPPSSWCFKRGALKERGTSWWCFFCLFKPLMVGKNPTPTSL